MAMKRMLGFLEAGKVAPVQQSDSTAKENNTGKAVRFKLDIIGAIGGSASVKDIRTG